MRTSVATESHEQLHQAVSPREAYDAVVDLLVRHHALHPVGAYVATHGGGFELDDDLPPRFELPETLSANHEELAAPLRCVAYSYRGRPLGAMVFDESEGTVGSSVAELLEMHFTPALFRTIYLSQTQGDLKRANEQLYYLNEMTKLLGQLDVELLLVNILELTSSILCADLGSVMLLQDGSLQTQIEWGLPHAAIAGLWLADDERLVDRIVREPKPLFLTEDDLRHDEADGYHFERLAVLPLVSHQQMLGVINLVGPAAQADFSPERLEVVRPGMGLAATALENALLVEIKLRSERAQEQLKLAQKIQRNLLPQAPPERAGLQVAGHSVPAQMIGGDYYDYFTLPDGTLGAVVADVAGKGVPAGLIMTAARAMFRSACMELRRPAKILDRVNRLLCAEDFNSRFVTAAFVKVEPEHERLCIATAGHEPPLIYRSEGGLVETCWTRAMALGLRDEAVFMEQETPFRPGDILVVHTDGVNEAMDPEHKQFGNERLAATLREGRDDGAAELLQRIVAAVNRHIRGAPRHDDTTLIVMRAEEPR